jgi:hypothetical protein
MTNSEWTEDEMMVQLASMELVKNQIYSLGVGQNNTRLIHFAGIMSALINMSRDSMNKGFCFMDANGLKAEDYQVRYLAEKFEIVFGSIFSQEGNRETFIKAMGWENVQKKD